MLEATDANVEKFTAWILRRNRSTETARVYKSHLTRSLAAGGGDLIAGANKRLRDKKLSPKTRRATQAALAQWGKFAQNTELLNEISEVKLPPALRVQARKELDLDDWRSILMALENPRKGRRFKIDEGMKHVLLLISLRGFRLGDVWRFKRDEVEEAVRTKRMSFEAKGNRRMEYDARPIMDSLKALLAIPGWKIIRDLIGKPSSADRVLNAKTGWALRSIAGEAKIDSHVYPHRMRRTYATHFVRKLNNDPQALVKLRDHMGWTNINTAAQYVDNVNHEELDQMGADLLADLRKR